MNTQEPPIITDLEAIKRLAEAQQDAFEVMGYMLELYEDISDAELDRIVNEVAAPVVDAVDCTACGNCCRALQVHVTLEDVAWLAEGLSLSSKVVIDRYISHEQCAEIGEWGKFNAQPCPLLDGTRCSVYAHRPETCRAYPEFADFRWLIDTYMEGAALCPIIYNTMVRMVARVDRL